MRHQLVTIVGAALLFTSVDLSAQATWVAEHQQTHELVPLLVGMNVQYKTADSARFVTGTIAACNDSTVVFITKKASVTVRHKNLRALKLRRSSGRRAAGAVLATLGGLGTFVGVFALATAPKGPDPSGVGTSSHTAGLVIGAVGLPILIGGIALSSKRTINLETVWRLKLLPNK